jgi:hypothetical protein
MHRRPLPSRCTPRLGCHDELDTSLVTRVIICLFVVEFWWPFCTGRPENVPAKRASDSACMQAMCRVRLVGHIWRPMNVSCERWVHRTLCSADVLLLHTDSEYRSVWARTAAGWIAGPGRAHHPSIACTALHLRRRPSARQASHAPVPTTVTRVPHHFLPTATLIRAS